MQVSFSAGKELIDQVEQLAERSGRSRSETIAMLLDLAIKAIGTGKLMEAQEPTGSQLLAMLRDFAESTEKRFKAIEKKLQEAK